MIWQTLQGDLVAAGDLVALSVLNWPDAVGRIVGPGDEGRVECLLGDVGDPADSQPKLQVEEYQLLMLLRKPDEAKAEVPCFCASPMPLKRRIEP